MAEQKQPLIDLVPSDCTAIQEIIEFANGLAEKEREEGWKKYKDASKCRTPLSRQLSSIVTGKLAKGCSWYDFADDSAWVAHGKIDEISLRVFKAARLYSRALKPGQHMAYHDAFACLVVAATTDQDIADKVAYVRKIVADREKIDDALKENHSISVEALSKLEKIAEKGGLLA